MRWEAWPPLVALLIGGAVFAGSIERIRFGAREDRDIAAGAAIAILILFAVSFVLVVRLGAS